MTLHILVTNDDGVSAPGLLVLAQAMRQFGEVSVVAPDHDWSGHGHTKHFKRPLRVQEVRLGDGTSALATDGSPADCVAMSVMGLLPQKIDLVVAGINSAANLGHDVSYSGTVAAIKEANIWGIAGAAVSLDIHAAANRSPTTVWRPALPARFTNCYPKPVSKRCFLQCQCPTSRPSVFAARA
ncbi:5'/3'-nucleotidase SurE [Candidatus Amarobacter glycogenicus]|uniref:5'/3'-nucleotidase SurE n=1 Tax=Candidatus Amarobacter glycogenicus TaxID=3140699 RepID=UPI002A1296CB|nr:5'/3'-nucleotidase SurE [Dehalococcoidia bacterium]